ncbi:hypothetical protein ONR75_25085 [Rhodopseudomonas sp. P2A-2r]|uniref:hypothetical protein n=1 Tax=Rhodopseudomonas sp. P2A-2r TaxID=2991972 RepID=UPI00223481B8|nr:hypothetical protein [Rhodopseudomonas sp. P2A-2r]UZE48087.1 hypothetical protein ONR75_25085 [Rhodopseudomonas sp. P2A-2r]
MPIRVLVSGAGGDVAQGVLKALRGSGLDLQLHATCISEHSAWLHAGIQGFIAPPSSDPDYVDYLIRLMRHLEIQVYFPTVDSEIFKIARARSFIEQETAALVFVDDVDKVAICDDKLRTAEFLRQGGFAYPRTASAEDAPAGQLAAEFGFPSS